ncbi:MAG: PaaI family thioesterase [Burkholderiaceae bacterium]|nr:MAG: PaaI family thioesterase [Burkholderiaceae bacterium]
MSTTPSIPSDPALYDRIESSFLRQGMMQHLGARLERVARGEVELTLPFSNKVTQQQGSFHGGAMGALADIAGGYAGLTTAPDDSEVATVEYKINFLASKIGGTLHAIGRVSKSGRRLIITTADVTHVADDGARTLCAIMQETLAVVPKKY